MKKFIIASSFLGLILSSCEKGTGYIDPSLDTNNGAKVKFVNASWNAPSLIIYGNDTTVKFSGGTPATGNILTGIGPGSTYPSNGYAIVGPYNDSLRVRVVANATVLPGLFTGVGKLNVQTGNTYSVFLVDSFPVLSTVVIEDRLRNFNEILDTTYDARFVNVIQGAPAVDVFSKNENAVIFSNVPYKGATEFKNFRRNSVTTADSIFIRLTGTSTLVGAARISFSPTAKRSYTWFARGKFGATTAATGQPVLSFYTNQ